MEGWDLEDAGRSEWPTLLFDSRFNQGQSRLLLAAHTVRDPEYRKVGSRELVGATGKQSGCQDFQRAGWRPAGRCGGPAYVFNVAGWTTLVRESQCPGDG